jgi:hypothetical protein
MLAEGNCQCAACLRTPLQHQAHTDWPAGRAVPVQQHTLRRAQSANISAAGTFFLPAARTSRGSPVWQSLWYCLSI